MNGRPNAPDGVDERWQAHEDRLALGDEVQPPDFEGDDPRWKAERDFYAELEADAAPMPADDPDADALLIAAALQATAPPAVSSSAVAATTKRGLGTWVALVGAAAAVGLLWLGWPAATLSISNGSWSEEDGITHQRGEALPLAMWLVADDQACAGIGGDAFCVEPGSVVRVRDVEARQLQLRHGEVHVESGQWSVLAATEQHTLRAGQSFAHRPPEDPTVARTTATVDRSAASASLPSNEPAASASAARESDSSDTPPEEPAAADAVPPERSPKRSRARAPSQAGDDAATLLRRARALRGKGESARAGRLYAELVKRYPKTAEADAGRVSLGQIRLKSGRAKSALALFGAYLQHGGPLAEEASWGRIQALDRLRRTEALQRAVADFETKFPRSVYLQRARERVQP